MYLCHFPFEITGTWKVREWRDPATYSRFFLRSFWHEAGHYLAISLAKISSSAVSCEKLKTYKIDENWKSFTKASKSADKFLLGGSSKSVFLVGIAMVTVPSVSHLQMGCKHGYHLRSLVILQVMAFRLTPFFHRLLQK